MQALKDIESDKIKSVLFSKLSQMVIGEYATYWYPLRELKAEQNVISFDSEFLEDRERLYIIKQIFEKHGISTVCVVPELENVYYSDSFLDDIIEIDEWGDYTFPYGSEEYTFDDTKEWMIYKSHEFTVTFAGKWLVQELKKNIKNYEIGVTKRFYCKVANSKR